MNKIPQNKYDYFLDFSKKNSWNSILLELRTHVNLTQQQVSDTLNIDRKTYGNYESGVAEIKIESIKKLSILYGIPSSIILGDGDIMIKFIEGVQK